MVDPITLKPPAAGEKQEVIVQANQQVNLGFDLSEARVDILGGDMVFTFKDGGQIVMPNMAVMVFSDDAPQIKVGNQPVSADEILSKIGMVQSISGQEAAMLTSMQPDKNSNATPDENVKIVEKIVFKESPPLIINPPTPLPQPNQLSVNGAKFEEQFKKTFDNVLDTRAKAVADNTNVGKYTVAPSITQPQKIEAQVQTPAPPNPISATYSFEPKLLQLSANSSVDGSNVLTYNGGGGSQSATLISDSLTQIQREFIDVTRHNGAATIYADNPTFTQPNLLSRAIDIVPSIPNSYALVNVLISGLPVGFDLLGFARQPDGSYLISGGQLTAGTQSFVLQYDPTALGAPSDIDGDGFAREYANFDVTISSSVFNGSAILTYVQTIPVIVKDTTTSDYSYVDDDGVTGWVLDVKPNENIIVAGDGGVTVYGGSVLDRISTGTGNDTVYGNAGDDTITTSSGNDTIDVGTGNNIVDGGDGVDLLSYSTRTEAISFDLGGAQNAFGEITVTVGAGQQDLVKGIENVTTGSGDDTLVGSVLANVLTGGAGNDFLMGRGGNDTLVGGDNIDTVSYSYAANGVTVDLQAGTAVVDVNDNDTIATVENIIGSDFNDTLRGDANVNNIQGGAGDDLINGRTGNDVIDGGAGNNTISFTDQTSGVTLTLANAGNSTATSAGGDSITLSNIQNITGSANDDVLTGNNVDNIIRSGAGNDTLDGGTGSADVLSYDDQGGAITADMGAGTVTKVAGSDSFANFDILTATSYDDTLIGGNLISVINGGDGTDTLSYQNTGASVTVNLVTQTTTGAHTHSFTSIENITGGSGNDILTGDLGVNVITGGAGDDTLNGGEGDDTLDGGDGTDTATFATYISSITASLGEANITVTTEDYDTVDSPDDVDGLDNELSTTTLLSIEVIEGTGLADTFQSGATSRTVSLNGGGGIDTMTFASETTAVNANLSSSATGAFGTYNFIGNSIENLIGGSNDDILSGTSGDNEITGGAGNDTLNGNGGTDTLDGGDGTDTATYASFAGAVTVDLAALEVTDAAAGVSTLVSIESIVGSVNADTFLSGLSIADFTLDGGGGIDTLSFAPLQAAVNANLTTGIATVGLGSQYTVSNFENLIGGGLNDTLRGDAGDNNIQGGAGNDIIYASGGTDTLDGGDGFDYFAYLNSVGDPYTVTLGTANIQVTDGNTINTTLINVEWVGGTTGDDVFQSGAISRNVTLDGNGGSDTISFATETTAVTANLGSSATGAFGTYSFYNSRIENITGGSGNDILTGTANNAQSNGNNIIIGGAGDDTINGNGGNDTIDGGDGTDTATFAAVTGNITVNLAAGTVNYTDASNNPSANTITSIEYIITGSGNDSFTAGGTGLTLSIDSGGGTDTISFAGQAAAVIADLTSTATGAFGTYTFISNSMENLTGGNGNDTLTGTSVANTIIGGNGNDTINGGAGADRLYGGNGSDTINGGDDADIIDDSGSSYASNNTNILNGDAGNDTIYTTVANNTIDGGAGTDTLRYDSSGGFGTNTSNALVFTLNGDSSGGTVTMGAYTDAFTSIERFYGSNGNDIFRGGSGNDTFFGGNGIDTADYSSAGSGVTASLTTNTANDGDGGTDTFNGIENLTGSNFNDTLTGSSTANVLEGGGGNDIFIGTAGNDVINGGNDTDTIDYTAQTAAITFDMNLSSVTSAALGTDTYVNVEQINSGSGDDIINSSPGSLFANTINFDLGGGSNDSIVLGSGTVGTDATVVANRISNVEYLDFRNANTAGGNMAIDGDDVFAMTDSNHAMRLDINGAFGLDITGGSYTLSAGPTVGGITTYTFSTGATPVATLEVHVA